MENKLTPKEKSEIAIEAGLQLVPYIGGALAALYFSTKQEKRFKRIESFYKEFATQIKQLQIQFPAVESHDEDKLTALIEELNEKVERENTQEKRAYFKQYLLSTLSSQTNENFDERRFFLTAISSMTLLECEILSFLYHKSDFIEIGNIKKIGVDQYAIVGAVGRLKLYGFLQDHPAVIGAYALHAMVAVTDFGRHFVRYSLGA